MKQGADPNQLPLKENDQQENIFTLIVENIFKERERERKKERDQMTVTFVLSVESIFRHSPKNTWLQGFDVG